MFTIPEWILLGTLATTFFVFIFLLFAVLRKLNEMTGVVTNQATSIQTNVEKRLDRLQLRADPVIEEVQQQLQLIQKRGEPIMDETHKLLISARPAVEQLTAILESVKPLLVDAHATVLIAKESAELAKATATTIKVEAESCMAAIRTTATELTRMTQEEAEGMRELIVTTRERAEHQIMRVDQMVTKTTDRLDETAHIVQTGVIKPVTEIAAVLAAVQRFMQVLFAQERKQIDEAYQDEEMFI